MKRDDLIVYVFLLLTCSFVFGIIGYQMGKYDTLETGCLGDRK